MHSRLRPALGTALFIAGPLAAVVALHRLGQIDWLRIDWTDPAGWFTRATAEEALAASLRSVALCVGYWLAASTVVYVLARATQIPTLIRFAGSFTLPMARRMADGLLIGSLAVATMAPLAARPPDPVVSTPGPVIAVLPPEDIEPSPTVRTPSGSPPTLQANEATEISDPSQSWAATYVVTDGDSLWSVAARRMEAHLGRHPTEPEIAGYWRVVVETNRQTLRSGDPDLIYPGEVITLPDTRG